MKPWEKYANNQQKQGPWSKYSEKREESGPSAFESAIRNFAEGASFNFSDELAGGLEAAGRVVGLEGLGGSNILDTKLSESGPTLNPEELSKAYYQARDNTRKDLAKDRKVNPKASAISNFSGAVLSPINKAFAGMSLAKAGLGVGAINAAGGSEADDVADLIVDTTSGAVVGYITGKGVEKISPYAKKVAQKISNNLKSGAEKMAARALGAERGTIKSLGSDKVEQAGRYALDNGLLSLRKNTGKMVDANKELLNKAGQSMDDVYRSVDDAGASTFNPLEVASKVDDNLGGFYRSPINRGETRQLENTLESILMRGEKNIPLKEAQVLKQELGKVANWKNNLNITDKEQMAREAYKIVSQNIDDAAQKGAEKIGVGNLVEKLNKAKSTYSAGKTAETLLENKFAREQGNKMFGLTDTMLGAGSLGYGGATGDWETAVGILAAKKGLEKYGPKIIARSMNRISKTIDLTPQVSEFLVKNPGSLKAIIEKLEKNIAKPPRAAERKSSNTDKDMVAGFKGKDRWALQGVSNIVESGKGDLLAGNNVEKLLSNARGKELLMMASKKNIHPKAMSKILKEIESIGGANGTAP